MNKMMKTEPTTITEKLAWLENRYWKFGEEERLDDHLTDLFKVDDDGQRTAEPVYDPLNDETRGLMVLGASGNGKTALVKRLLRVDPVLTKFKINQGGNTLFITVPPEATIKKLGHMTLSMTGYTKVDEKLKAADAWEIGRHRFGLVGIKTLVIDECHHILRPGPGRDVPGAIQALKHIMQSEHGVVLIIAGVPGLKDAILSEPTGETIRRFNELPLTRILPKSRGAASFGNNFAKSANILGLDFAKEDALADRILFAERGQVGKCVALGKGILRAAITRKQDVITLDAADRVFRKSQSGLDITPFKEAEWDVVKAELIAIGWGQ